MRELSLNVLDVAQNSIAAGAKLVQILVAEQTAAQAMSIRIVDDGRGMTPEQVKQVCDPFFTTRTTRKVGLGVPLFKMAAEMTGGSFAIESEPGKGTAVRAEFHTAHVDMTPLGDIDATVALLIRCNPSLDFLFVHTVNQNTLRLDTRELRGILGADAALDHPDVMEWIEGYLQEQNELLYGGANRL